MTAIDRPVRGVRVESGADDFIARPVDGPAQPERRPSLSGLAGDARLNYTARDDVKPSGLPQEASE